jgi:hypothetical protein
LWSIVKMERLLYGSVIGAIERFARGRRQSFLAGSSCPS